MYSIQKVLVSTSVSEEFFCCDLQHCKGACCVEGDVGATVEPYEIPLLEEALEEIKPYLTPQGLAVLEKAGIVVRTDDGSTSTPLIHKRECAYSHYDSLGILKCGIEEAYRAGKTSFPKPISCHLYPLRRQHGSRQELLFYDRWKICESACVLGKNLKLPLYLFLKEPLIRHYGESWYQELVSALEKKKNVAKTSLQ
jgi:hypothetical protein